MANSLVASSAPKTPFASRQRVAKWYEHVRSSDRFWKANFALIEPSLFWNFFASWELQPKRNQKNEFQYAQPTLFSRKTFPGKGSTVFHVEDTCKRLHRKASIAGGSAPTIISITRNLWTSGFMVRLRTRFPSATWTKWKNFTCWRSTLKTGESPVETACSQFWEPFKTIQPSRSLPESGARMPRITVWSNSWELGWRSTLELARIAKRTAREFKSFGKFCRVRVKQIASSNSSAFNLVSYKL